MRVAVLGGGLQGACAAMEIAARGTEVYLFEGRRECVTGASAQNEGKVHLGYVYGKDRTLSTARIMVRGALSFGPLLRRWLGDAVDSVPVSRPFHYVVHRQSLLGVDEVEAHLNACSDVIRREADGSRPDYFGVDPRIAPARVGRRELVALYRPDAVRAVFRTPEIAIDPESLAALIRARLADDRTVRRHLSSRVHGVERRGAGFDVEYEDDAGPGRRRYDQVVNALGDGKLTVDRMMGLELQARWLWRIKHYVRLSVSSARLPCATIVLGRFGDVVAYGNRELSLSWYPAGLRGISNDVQPPTWPSAADGGFADEVRRQTIDGLGAIVRGVSRDSGRWRIRGGVILASGETDIDDPESGLHERHAIGVRSIDGYHSINTGKLTTAPLFAREVADRVLGSQ
jgi:hypothetical protein